MMISRLNQLLIHILFVYPLLSQNSFANDQLKITKINDFTKCDADAIPFGFDKLSESYEAVYVNNKKIILRPNYGFSKCSYDAGWSECTKSTYTEYDGYVSYDDIMHSGNTVYATMGIVDSVTGEYVEHVNGRCYSSLVINRGTEAENTLCRSLFQGTNVKEVCNGSFTLKIGEIAPELEEKFKILESEWKNARSFGRGSIGLYNKVKDINNIIENLNSKPFGELTESDLAFIYSLWEIYEQLKGGLDKLKQETIDTIEKIRKEVDENKDRIRDKFAEQGIDLDENLSLSPTNIVYKPIELPNLGSGQGDSSSYFDKHYVQWADETINSLDSLYKAGKRRDFLLYVYFWEKEKDTLLDHLINRSLLDNRELIAFQKGISRVESYLFGNIETGNKGLLNRRYWFLDSLIPKSMQVNLDNIFDRNSTDPFLTNLRSILNSWESKHSNGPSSQEKAFINTIYAFVSFLEMFKDVYEAAIENGYDPNASKDRLTAEELMIRKLHSSFQTSKLKINQAIDEGMKIVEDDYLITHICNLTGYKRCSPQYGTVSIKDSIISGAMIGTVFGFGSSIVRLPPRTDVFDGTEIFGNSFQHVTKTSKDFVTSAVGKRFNKSRLWGYDELPDGNYKHFDKTSEINNPLPSDGVYAKAIERDFAEAIKDGTGRLAGRNSNEGWITAASDLKGIKRSDLAERLGLYTDKAGTKLKNTNDYVVVEFKLKDPSGPGISTPVDPTGTQRQFGWIPGGRTKGGAREWLINADAPNNGIIDLATVKIIELTP
ncbi:MAG: polymorphic toxin type 10 domain-containing protein [Oligoflexus sp.]